MPLAVIDLETTGLTPGVDRVVEVAVFRIDPGNEPKLVLDTLVNPERPVSGSEIHGITDEDVADAPTFDEIAGAVVEALSDCVVAAYNVYFEARFLRYELRRARLRTRFPHVCLMYLRPLLGLGGRASLDDVCDEYGIRRSAAHMAAADAEAASRLCVEVYMPHLKRLQLQRLADLARLAKYKFLESLVEEPLRPPRERRPERPAFKSRYLRAQATPARTAAEEALARYWEALQAVLADLEVTPEERLYLQKRARELALRPEQVRTVHARVFASLLQDVIEDSWLDQAECDRLRAVYRCLAELGWAPGQ